MILKLIDGPMSGATYHLDRSKPNTNRKPDGLWFDGQDENGKWIKHEYRELAVITTGDGVEIHYAYDGSEPLSGIDAETKQETL